MVVEERRVGVKERDARRGQEMEEERHYFPQSALPAGPAFLSP